MYKRQILVASGSGPLQALLTAVMERFRTECHRHLEVPGVPSSAASTGRGAALGSPGQLRFCRRRGWRALKLLVHMCGWQGLLAQEALSDLCSSHLVDAVLPLLSHQIEWLCLARERGGGGGGEVPGLRGADLAQLGREVRGYSGRLAACLPAAWVQDQPDSALALLKRLVGAWLQQKPGDPRELQALLQIRDLIRS